MWISGLREYVSVCVCGAMLVLFVGFDEKLIWKSNTLVANEMPNPINACERKHHRLLELIPNFWIYNIDTCMVKQLWKSY